jgi:hypothetical protein
MMRVFVTGTEGYLGFLLAPELVRQGYDVIGPDTGFYKERAFYQNGGATPLILARDLRHIEPKDLQGVDAVVHMAELSNDPAGQLAPSITYEINHRGSVHLAELARKAGVKRFVYMSCCSVYGVSEEDEVIEESRVDLRTACAICKTLGGRDVKQLARKGFSPSFMRNATAYGASPRMRFDIVLNNLAGFAWTTKRDQDDQRWDTMAAISPWPWTLRKWSWRIGDDHGHRPEASRGEHPRSGKGAGSGATSDRPKQRRHPFRDLLKAGKSEGQLRPGNRSMVGFCREHGIKHEVRGKVIVAAKTSERERAGR